MNRIFPLSVWSYRAFGAACALPSTLLSLAFVLSFAAPGAAQSGTLNLPQTQLAPLGGNVGGGSFQSPSGFAPSASPGYTPSSNFDPYSGGPAAGFINPGASISAPSGGFLGGTTAMPGNMPPPTFGNPSANGTLFGNQSSYGSPVYGGSPVFGGSTGQPPALFGGTGSGGLFGSNGFGGAALGGAPTGIPSTAFGGPALGGPAFGGTVYGAPGGYNLPASAYPSGAPSTLFPGGLFGSTPSYNPQFNPYRLIQRARFRHTFLSADDSADSLEINDTDVAFAFAFPRFLWSPQPLFVTPSFSLHLWDGPNASTGADLPPNAYSAFLDFSWQSDPNRILGAELGVNVGAFSEFSVFSSDSIRVRGKGLGTFRLTPASTLKLGAYYYDRVKTKLLPAGGILWRPNAFTRFDIFFPQPKFSRYLSTVGVNDVWWYVSGDYGGGSWTIERDNGDSDQVDINDIRVMAGFEWGQSDRMRAGLRSAFFEFGYVGDRELIYRHNRGDDLELDDAWMFRLGIGY